MARMNYRVLVAEVDREVAQAIEALMHHLTDLQIDVVHTQTFRSTVRTLITEAHIDAALIDLRLADLRLPESIQELAVKAPRTALVALTTPTGVDDLSLIRSGVAECVPIADLSPARISQAIAQAVERKGVERRVQRLAEHDELTGIGNRRQLQSRFEVLRAQRARRGGELLGAIFNLDGFTQLNDAYGLHAGDDTLRRLALVLLEQVRIEDVVARLGGDEFVVAMLDESATNAEMIVRRVHAALMEALEGLPLPIGVSGGAAFATDDASLRDLLGTADHVLTDVKTHAPGTIRVGSVAAPVVNGAH